MSTHEYDISRNLFNNDTGTRIKLIIHDCCMKKIVRATMYNLFNKTLTTKECMLLCIYYYIVVLLLNYIVLSYNVSYILISYYLNNHYISNFISMVINILITIREIEELKNFVYIIFCSCEQNRNRITTIE